ncbi:hypothetical protein [Trichormus variabilis]|uniref:Conjugal transfer protein TrbJ n=1 Tax=Trichormus variabilis SAG 1403-4b TaxID=447716 RepID=A0A3S1AL11_ANAVA|nr:hypothetical protein [Trichormus variabilis]MBD2628987.1 hypothetical protein [Trichormus variabilis FACHB-164]RUS94512.1 hypothetical protein DSM107003_36410 [Trichormus variabilis SAG 1403-4b]
MKSNKKKLISTAITSGFILAVITIPSNAFAIDLGGELDNFFNQTFGYINGYFNEVANQLKEEVDKSWGNLQKDAQAAIEESKGNMGIPDPTAASQKLADKLQEKGGIASESSTIIGAVEAGKQLERDSTRATVASVLGKEGQQRTQSEIDATNKTVGEAQQLAEDAQNMDASQDVLKAIAAQNAQIVSMLGQVRTDGLQARHDAQQTNLMLNQIAESQSEQNRARRVLSTGMTSQYLELTGWSRLDPAYVNK